MEEKRCILCGAVVSDGDKYCRACGGLIPRDEPRICCACGHENGPHDLFCVMCGTSLTKAQEKKKEKKERKHLLKKILLRTAAVLAVISVMTGLFLLAAGGGIDGASAYSNAVSQLLAGRSDRACYYLGQTDTAISRATLRLAMKKAYEKGVSLYRQGLYGEATTYFDVCGDTENSENYRLLLRAHRATYYYNDNVADGIVSQLRDIWDFEDASQAMVSNRYVSNKWLSGLWETKDGFFHFEIKDGIRSNIPGFGDGDAFVVEDAKVWFFYTDNMENKTAGYELYPISEDLLCVYSITNGRYYNLSRVSEEVS